jgi:hypothetical protein
MLFFKRVLDVRKPPTVASDRREALRFAVSRQFPIQTVLNIAGRDKSGDPLTNKDGRGWDWPGLLVDISKSGVRIQVPLTVQVRRGDEGLLKLDVEGYKLEVPCAVAHVEEKNDVTWCGLMLTLPTSEIEDSFNQLLDLVALGSSLKLVRPQNPDESGYLLECFEGEISSRLSLWRHKQDRRVSAFEFRMKDCFVRGLEGGADLEFFTGTDATSGRVASQEKGEEIRRLYQWVVLNLSPAVPADAREFLLKSAI